LGFIRDEYYRVDKKGIASIYIKEKYKYIWITVLTKNPEKSAIVAKGLK